MATDRQKEGGIKGVKHTPVSDQAKTISENYDVLAGEWEYNEDRSVQFNGTPRSYRGLFLIDKKGIVRHQVANDMPIGRSIDEALRVADALRSFEEIGEVCPAHWHKCDAAMKPTQEGVSNYLATH